MTKVYSVSVTSTFIIPCSIFCGSKQICKFEFFVTRFSNVCSISPAGSGPLMGKDQLIKGSFWSIKEEP